MKLIIAGTEYDIADSMQKASLMDLYKLKVETKIGMKTLSDSLKRMGELSDPEAFLDDEQILQALVALIWLCRRRAGEKLTLEEANSVPLADISFKVDVETPDDASEPDFPVKASDLADEPEATSTTT